MQQQNMMESTGYFMSKWDEKEKEESASIS